MESRGSDIVGLPVKLPLPALNIKCMENGSSNHHMDGNGVDGFADFERPTKLSGASPRKGDAVAPYQALPVTGDLITEHLTPELPVIDHANLTPEVRLLFCKVIKLRWRDPGKRMLSGKRSRPHHFGSKVVRGLTCWFLFHTITLRA